MKMNGIIGLLMAMVMLSSCRKDLDLFSNGFTSVSEDYTTQQDILESNETEISEQIENGLLALSTRSFPTRTWSNPKGTYPNILTIDYGPTGVTGPYGRIRRGKLIVQISAPLNIPGSVRTVSHEQFYIDGRVLEKYRIVLLDMDRRVLLLCKVFWSFYLSEIVHKNIKKL